MRTYEEAITLANQKILEAQRALDDHAHGIASDPELVRRLVMDISAAREELLRLLSGMTADGKM